MLRWYWYLCGSIHAKQTRLLREHQDEDYEKWRKPRVARGVLDLAGGSPHPPAVFHAKADDEDNEDDDAPG